MNLKAYRRLLSYVDGVSRSVTLKVLMLVMESATYIVQAIACAHAVSSVLTGGDLKAITQDLCIVAAVVLVRTALAVWVEIFNKKLASVVKSKIRIRIYDKLVELGPKYVDDKRCGKIQSLLLDGIESLEPFLINYVPQMIALFVTGLLIAGYSCYLDIPTGLIMIAVMLLCLIVPVFTMPWVRQSMVSYWTNYSTLNANYIEAIQGITTLKAFNSSKQKREDLRDFSQKFYETQIHNTTFSVLDSGIMIALTAIAAYVTVGIAAYRADQGLLYSAAISIFLFLSSEFSRPMMALNGAWHNSFLGLSVLNDMFAILEEPSPDVQTETKDSTSLDHCFPEIEFCHVTFTYPNGKKPALEDVSFRIPAGSTAAIVGQSGSGKSTVVNLLCRYYEVDQGEILVGGKNIREYDLRYLRKQIGVVFQENYLFNGTIAENIAMPREDASLEEIKQAAIASGADEYIREMPLGYHTMIGERGADLSGGQRQRLAIARTIMKKASVMMFDEATSNVDAANEALIMEMIDRLSYDQTTIIIAHRLSTIRNADKIILLDNGHVKEEGTHEELMASDGLYHRLVRIQTSNPSGIFNGQE